MTPFEPSSPGAEPRDRVDFIRRRMLQQLQHEANLSFDREARFPRNDEEVDPVVRDLYQGVAFEITRLEDRVRALTTRSVDALARRLADPLRMRQPACTVVSVMPRDSGVEFAPGVTFARSSAQGTEVFTSTEPLTAHRASVPCALVVCGRDAAVVRSETAVGEDDDGPRERVENHTLPPEFAQKAAEKPPELRVYLPIVGEFAEGTASVDLFFVGNQRLLDQLLCGSGYLANAEGEFEAAADCCTAVVSQDPAYEILRNPLRIRSTLRSARGLWGRSFFRCRLGAVAKQPAEVRELGPGVFSAFASLGTKKVRWLKVVIERGAVRDWAEGLRGLHTNCVAASNARRPVVAAYSMPYSLMAPTGGRPGRLEYEIELPLECCEVESVRDQEANQEYFDVHQLLENRSDRGRYKVVLRTRGDGSHGPVLVLLPPERHDPQRPLRPQLHLLECSAASEVNRIQRGEVNVCHEPDPRIVAIANVVPVAGAIDAALGDLDAAERGSGLPTRVEPRLVTLQDFEAAVNAHAGTGASDRRIVARSCQFQPFRVRGALVQGVQVHLTFERANLSSQAEAQFVAARLQRELAARALANVEVRVAFDVRVTAASSVGSRASERRT